MMARPRRTWTVLMWALTALPPLMILSLITTLGVNVPFQDDWDTASVLVSWRRGNLGFADFWEQHSEHRIAAVRALIWLSGALTDFNVVAQMFLGFACVALTFVFVRRLLADGLEGEAPTLLPFMTATASFMLFSLSLQENWLLGTASVELVLLPASAVLIWALTRWPDQWGGLALAICGAVVGMLAEASGMALWVTGALTIYMTDRAALRRNRRLGLWAAATMVAVSAYVWGLSWEHSALQTAALAPLRSIRFASACLGLPFAYGRTPAWSTTVGLSGCAALAVAAVHVRRMRPVAWRRLVPLLLLAVHGILISGLISVGRSGWDPRPAMTSHYSVGAPFFWIGTFVMVAMAVTIVRESGADISRIVTSVAISAGAIALVLGYIMASIVSYREAYQRSRNLEMALASLYSQETISKDVSRFLYPPDDGRIQRQLVELRDLGLGPFSKRMQARRARLVERFTSRRPGAGSEGFHDGGDCERTLGWAWDPARPDEPIMVDIWYRGEKIGTATANWFRPDLLAAGKGNGQHAFVFVFPTLLEAGTGQVMTVMFAGTTNPVDGSPKVITCQ